MTCRVELHLMPGYSECNVCAAVSFRLTLGVFHLWSPQNFGIFWHHSPCLHLELIYNIKLAEPPLLVCFSVTPPPRMWISYIEAPLACAWSVCCCISAPKMADPLWHFMGFIRFLPSFLHKVPGRQKFLYCDPNTFDLCFHTFEP